MRGIAFKGGRHRQRSVFGFFRIVRFLFNERSFTVAVMKEYNLFPDPDEELDEEIDDEEEDDFDEFDEDSCFNDDYDEDEEMKQILLDEELEEALWESDD